MRTKQVRVDPDLLERVAAKLRKEGYNFQSGDCVEHAMIQLLKEDKENEEQSG